MSSTLAALRPCSTKTASAARSSSILARRSAGLGIVDWPVNYREASGLVKGRAGEHTAAPHGSPPSRAEYDDETSPASGIGLDRQGAVGRVDVAGETGGHAEVLRIPDDEELAALVVLLEPRLAHQREPIGVLAAILDDLVHDQGLERDGRLVVGVELRRR